MASTKSVRWAMLISIALRLATLAMLGAMALGLVLVSLVLVFRLAGPAGTALVLLLAVFLAVGLVLRTPKDVLLGQDVGISASLAPGTVIKVWRFKDAPTEYRDLSPCGGDEDWLAFVPAAMQDEWMPWLREGVFGNDVSVRPVAGGEVHISAHA